MGAYSPSRLYNSEMDKKIKERIIYPTLKGIKELGTDYCGFYIGLMIVNNEPFLIEFNVRMGDPVSNYFDIRNRFGEIILSCCNKKLIDII